MDEPKSRNPLRPDATPPPSHAGFAERVVMRAPGIVGLCAVGAAGSWADGRLDEHSDLDLVLVTEPGAFADEAERRELAEELGRLHAAIPGREIGNPRLLLCLYGEPVLHVDFLFVEGQDLAGLGQRVEALWSAPDAGGLEWPKPKPLGRQTAQWCEDRVWFSLHYLISKTARGELHEALSALGWFRSSLLVPLLGQRHGLVEPGLRRIEQSGIPELPALSRTHALHDRDDVVRAIGESVALYLELREQGAGLVANEAAERELRDHFEACFGRPL